MPIVLPRPCLRGRCSSFQQSGLDIRVRVSLRREAVRGVDPDFGDGGEVAGGACEGAGAGVVVVGRDWKASMGGWSLWEAEGVHAALSGSVVVHVVGKVAGPLDLRLCRFSGRGDVLLVRARIEVGGHYVVVPGHGICYV